MPDLTYYNTFLRPAHPFRWAKEQVSIPRDKLTLLKVNSDMDIEMGFKRRGLYTESLKRLSAYGKSKGKQTGKPFNVLRCSLKRKENSDLKKWILTSYENDTSVSFIQFDVDCHISSSMTIDEQQEIEQNFNKQVQAISKMADDIGIDIVWTTSPGDMVDDKHVQGVYAWIKLEKPVKVIKLKKYVKALKEYHSLYCESSVDSKNRLIRLPGQRHVEVVDPISMKVINPIKKQIDTFIHFSDAWHKAEPVSLKALFDKAVKWKIKEQENNNPVSSSIKNNIQISCCSTNDALAEKDTFKAATERRICSCLTIKYQGNPFYFERAVEEAKIELSRNRPVDSKTCRDPYILHATCTRWMRHYFSHYDSSRCLSSKRNQEDEKRYFLYNSIDKSFLLRVLKKLVHLSFRELKIVSALYDKMQTWRGRVYCKELYALAGSKAAWLKLKKKLYCLLVILDMHDIQMKKCRQWGWSDNVLKHLFKIKEAQLNNALLLPNSPPQKHVLGERDWVQEKRWVNTRTRESNGVKMMKNGIQSKEFQEN